MGIEEEESALLRVSEAAKLFGVSPSTVRRMMGDGALPTIRVRGAVRIPRGAVMAWIAARTAEARSDAAA